MKTKACRILPLCQTRYGHLASHLTSESRIMSARKFLHKGNKNLSPLRSQPTNCQLENGDIRISIVKIQVILHELDTLPGPDRLLCFKKKRKNMWNEPMKLGNELEIKTNWLRKPSQTPGQGPLTTVLTRSPQSQKIHRNGYTEKSNIPNKIIKHPAEGSTKIVMPSPPNVFRPTLDE